MDTEALTSFFETIKNTNNQLGGNPVLGSIESNNLTLFGGEEKKPEQKPEQKTEKKEPETTEALIQNILQMMRDLSKKHDMMKEDQKALNKKLETSNQKSNEVSGELEKVKKENSELKTTIDSQSDYEELKKAISELTEKVESKDKDNADKDIKITRLEKQVDELERHVKDVDREYQEALDQFTDIGSALTRVQVDEAKISAMVDGPEEKNEEPKPKADPFKKETPKEPAQQGGEIDDLLNFSEMNSEDFNMGNKYVNKLSNLL